MNGDLRALHSMNSSVPQRCVDVTTFTESHTSFPESRVFSDQPLRRAPGWLCRWGRNAPAHALLWGFMEDFLVEEVVRMRKSVPQKRRWDETVCISFSVSCHEAQRWAPCW